MAELTAAELAEIERIMNDPFQASFNQYGQGNAFWADGAPDSWSAAEEAFDMNMDALKAAELYVSDLVDPYEVVEDPGEYEGFVNWNQQGSNPAIQAVQTLMAETNMPFEEAVYTVFDAARNQENPGRSYVDGQLVDNEAESGPRISGIPLDENGQPDLEQFQYAARDWFENAGRESAERAAYDAQLQAYEDYVNPRSNLDILGPQEAKAVDPTDAALLDYANSRRTQTFNPTPGSQPAAPRDTVNEIGISLNGPVPIPRDGPSRRGGPASRPISYALQGLAQGVPQVGYSGPRPEGARALRPRSDSYTQRAAGHGRSRKSERGSTEGQDFEYARAATQGNKDVAEQWNRRAARTAAPSKEQANHAARMQAIVSLYRQGLA